MGFTGIAVGAAMVCSSHMLDCAEMNRLTLRIKDKRGIGVFQDMRKILCIDRKEI